MAFKRTVQYKQFGNTKRKHKYSQKIRTGSIKFQLLLKPRGKETKYEILHTYIVLDLKNIRFPLKFSTWITF